MARKKQDWQEGKKDKEREREVARSKKQRQAPPRSSTEGLRRDEWSTGTLQGHSCGSAVVFSGLTLFFLEWRRYRKQFTSSVLSGVCLTSLSSLSISTNWRSSSPSSEATISELLLHLSSRVASIAHVSEGELLMELLPGQHLVFGQSLAPAAHCLWAFGAPLDKWQNSQLHKTVAAALEKYLEISASRVRITRIQLYEILDVNSQLEAASRPVVPSGTSGTSGAVISPRSPKERTLSPRSKEAKKEKKEKKGWSKSLEKKKAGELTAAKERKTSESNADKIADRIAEKIADESDSSEKSGKMLLEKEFQ